IYSFLILHLFGAFECIAQIKPLEVGDKCPDELLEYLYDQPGVNQEKSILIDFWATWCVPCIKALPLLDSLQLHYKDKLAILSVTYENDKKAKEVLSKVFENSNYSFTVLTDNKFLIPYFAYQSVPHYIWIDANGIVQAITGDKESLNTGIPQFLDGHPLKVKMKTHLIEYSGKKPLFGSGLATVGDELEYHSVISKYREDLGGGYFRGSNFITCVNSPIIRLFQMAFGKF